MLHLNPVRLDAFSWEVFEVVGDYDLARCFYGCGQNMAVFFVVCHHRNQLLVTWFNPSVGKVRT